MLTDDASGARKSLHGNWSSRLAFVLAVTGSAVGLGNIWKFPYVAGQNGGGAFVLVLIWTDFMGLGTMLATDESGIATFLLFAQAMLTFGGVAMGIAVMNLAEDE